MTGRIVPIHPTVQEVSSGHLRRAIFEALAVARPVSDPVPEVVLAELGLMERDTAIGGIHFPETLDQVAASRRRLAFDELFRLEVALAAQQRHRRETSKGIVHDAGRTLARHFVDHLPFRLTSAQVRALEEIEIDLASADPMHRLLQGEVGSGKTVVAVASLLAGVEGGYQGAVMAPTEVLAGQHFLSITVCSIWREWLPTSRAKKAVSAWTRCSPGLPTSALLDRWWWHCSPAQAPR